MDAITVARRWPDRAGHSRVVWLLAMGWLGFAGCSSLPDKEELRSYDQVSLVYLVEPKRFESEDHIEQVSHVVDVDPIVADLESGYLTIDYPHPEGIPGMALVELEVFPRPDDRPFSALASRGEKRPARHHSIQLHKFELDRLLETLEEEGYFSRGTNSPIHTKLVVELDGSTMKRRWRREPVLDRLILRVARGINSEEPAELVPTPPAAEAGEAGPRFERLPPTGGS